MEQNAEPFHILTKILQEKENSLPLSKFSDIEISLFDISRRLGVACEVAFRIKEKGIRSELFELEVETNEKKIWKNLKFLKKLREVDDFILLKGFSIAHKYYGDLRRRHTGDIDILVKDICRFRTFFEKEGFSRVELSKVKEIIGHVETFFKGGISVGVHTFTGDRSFSDIKFEDVESEEIKIEFGNLQLKIKTLKKYWDFVQVSLHLFQHAFPLRILLDVHKILKKLNQEDLKAAELVSQKFSVKNELLISALTSEKFFEGNESAKYLLRNAGFIGSIYYDVISDFLSSELYFLKIRPKILSVPYIDKAFSLVIALKFPFRKILSILPVLPKEFVRRLRKEYETTD